jgi:serine/threonine protein kinase
MYRCIKKIDGGGFADVYLYRDINTGKKVAVK